MRYTLFRSIKTHLLFLVLMSLLPALGIVLYEGMDRRSRDIEETRANALRAIQSLGYDHERAVESTRQLLMTLAKLPEVRGRNGPECSRLFAQILKESPLYTNIFAAIPEGMVFASGVPAAARSLWQRSYFQDVLRTRAFCAGEYHIGMASGRRVLSFAYPVVGPRGVLSGVVVASLDLNSYGQMFTKTRLPEDSVFVMFDRRHMRLYRSQQAEEFVGKADSPDMIAFMAAPAREGTFTGIGPDKIKRLYAYRRLYLKDGSAPYLFMRVGIPERKVLLHARNTLLRSLMLLCCALAVAMASAWFLGKGLIVRRLDALAEASRRLGQGDLAARTGLAHRDDELGRLTNAFDAMAEKLEQRDSSAALAEEALRQSEEKYRNIFENAVEGIYQCTPEGRFLSANPAFARIYGYKSPQEVLETLTDGQHRHYVSQQDLKTFREILQRDGFIENYETLHYRKDGTTIWVSSSARVVRGPEGKLLCYEGTVEDITGRKGAEHEKARLQSQLLQAQKMEAIGTLAGGIAHDFNNILMVLMGYGNLLQMKMDGNDPLRIYVDQILASTGKAANLTQSLLTFGRKQVIELRPHKVSTLLRDVEKLLGRLLPEDIGFKASLGADATIMADMTQIAQVLMNLATNARDAMPRGGDLRIETARVEIDGEFKRIHGFGEPGKYALISVADTGTGIDEKTKERIFEPFFTTKEVGKGTGLGLSIVYGIVKQHGGYITVESEQGRGTVFRIYLPEVKAEAAPETKEVAPDLKGGTETILLAEDNPDIRRMTSHTLAMSGYTVIEAADGRDAVEKFRKYQDKIKLIILDVVMPEKNGKEAYEETRTMRRDVKALFMSGYTSDVVLDKGVFAKGLDFIAKPIAPNDLLHKVRNILDR